MDVKKSYSILLDYIGTGEGNAVSGDSLSIMSGLSDRERKFQIQKARKDGIIICSNEHGYFYPDNVEEIASFYKRLHNSAITTLTVLKTTRAELIKSGLNPKEICGG